MTGRRDESAAKGKRPEVRCRRSVRWDRRAVASVTREGELERAAESWKRRSRSRMEQRDVEYGALEG